jgi:hypothetical protein
MSFLSGLRDPGDEERAGGGPRLLVSTFGRLLWYFPATDGTRLVHEGRGKYYGMAQAGTKGLREIWVVSRPDQEQDDRLLRIDQWRGKVRQKVQLASRDTHQAVRAGDRLYVADTFRGRVLVHSLPRLEPVREFGGFTHENHVNSVLVEGDSLLVLCHNKGKSHMARLDLGTGDELDLYPDVGEHSHDIVRWRDEYLICDSRGGGLVAVHRGTKALRVLHADEGHFTKGLAVAGDVAYFGISQAAVREKRHEVRCELLAYDLAADTVLWRRRLETRGLINMILTADDLVAAAAR